MQMEYQSDRFLRRFWSKISIKGVDDCWPWMASATGHGYGNFGFAGKTFYAHRVAYEASHGTIADGLVVMHTCDNRLCCNPRHLSAGTIQDNIADRDAKGRQARGAGNGIAKLTEGRVRAIRLFLDNGVRGSDLANVYGVQPSTIYAIKQRRTWRHIL